LFEFVAALMLVCLIGIPIAGIYSLKEWRKTRPSDFPIWRNVLGVGSIYAILGGWLIICIMSVLCLVNKSWIYFQNQNISVALLFVVFSATLLCVLLLKGNARLLAAVAGVSFLLLASSIYFWLTSEFI
jgi:hypothetical protein